MAEQGSYTSEYTRKINREDRRTMSEQFLARAAPAEVTLAQADLTEFKGMNEKEQLSTFVRMHRGKDGDLFLTLAAGAGFYGIGQKVQSIFPYTMMGQFPVIPVVVGGAAIVHGFLAKRRLGYRLPMLVSGLTMILGGSSLTGAKL